MKPPALLLLLVLHCESVLLPPSFKKCSRNQPDLAKCMRETAAFNMHQLVHPFRDLQVPGLKPLKIPALTIGSGKRAVAVEQRYTDCNIYGFDHPEFDTFEFDFQEKTLNVDVRFPEVTKNCKYQLNGKVMLLPVVGEGESTLVLKDARISGYLDYEEDKRNGKTYLKFIDHHLALDVGHVYFHFDNLFDGQKELGDNINKILNDNWRDVFDDVKEGYVQVVNTIIQSLLTNFWQKVSLEDALDPH